MTREELIAAAEALEWVRDGTYVHPVLRARLGRRIKELRAQAEAMPRVVREGRDFDVKFHDNGAAQGMTTQPVAGTSKEEVPAAVQPSAAQPTACLCCGTQTSGVAIQHAECAEAVICASCVEVLRAAPDLAARVARLEELLQETQQFGAFGVGSTLAERIRAALAEGEE